MAFLQFPAALFVELKMEDFGQNAWRDLWPLGLLFFTFQPEINYSCEADYSHLPEHNHKDFQGF